MPVSPGPFSTLLPCGVGSGGDGPSEMEVPGLGVCERVDADCVITTDVNTAAVTFVLQMASGDPGILGPLTIFGTPWISG